MMTIRSPKWTHLTTSTLHKHLSPNLERRTAVSLAQPNDIVERSPQQAEKSDLKILHISFYMILGYGDTMDDEGVNNAECSSEEVTLGEMPTKLTVLMRVEYDPSVAIRHATLEILNFEEPA